MFNVNGGRASVLAATVSICALVVGCAGTTDEGDVVSVDTMTAVDSDVATKKDDTTWTTTSVCTACGCTVSGFVCNCGARPSQKKLDCIANGGPPKVFSATFATSP